MNRNINIFGLVLTTLFLSWTTYTVYELWQGIKIDLCMDEQNIRFCSTWNDLANALTFILIGITFFFILLNPIFYHPFKSYLRAVIFLPILLTFSIMTMFGMLHAGQINGTHFGWWFVLTIADTSLIIIGLILRWRKKHMHTTRA
jgi:hypothetical protein